MYQVRLKGKKREKLEGGREEKREEGEKGRERVLFPNFFLSFMSVIPKDAEQAERRRKGTRKKKGKRRKRKRAYLCRP